MHDGALKTWKHYVSTSTPRSAEAYRRNVQLHYEALKRDFDLNEEALSALAEANLSMQSFLTSYNLLRIHGDDRMREHAVRCIDRAEMLLLDADPREIGFS